MMEKRKLGQTGLDVSVIGLGTVKIGRNQGVKYPQGFELPTDEDVRLLLETARELGVNLIDTAPAYGVSEARLGQLLPGNRSDWVICTKVGEDFEAGESRHDFSAQATRASVQRSLARLRTEWLDLVLVHSDGNDVTIIESSGCLEELAKLKAEGWIRAFGVSTKTVEGGILAAQETDCVMATFNPWNQEEEPVLEAAHKLGKGVLIKKAFASGHFGAGQGGPTEALSFILKREMVSSVILGTLNPRHLRENASF